MQVECKFQCVLMTQVQSKLTFGYHSITSKNPSLLILINLKKQLMKKSKTSPDVKKYYRHAIIPNIARSCDVRSISVSQYVYISYKIQDTLIAVCTLANEHGQWFSLIKLIQSKQA